MNVKAWSVVACAVAGIGGSALADPLPPGDSVQLGGTTTSQTPWLAGVNSTGTATVQFEVRDAGNNPVFQGTLQSSAAVSNDLGTLTFRYRIVNTQAVGDRRVSRVDFGGYKGFQTNVNYSTDSLGSIGPDEAARTANGAQVAFFFADSILPAEVDSRSFWVHTDASSIAFNGQAAITLNTGESVVIGGLRYPVRIPDCPGDANGDGIINFTDLNAVLTNFGDGCD
jgi:hypothetical protein